MRCPRCVSRASSFDAVALFRRSLARGHFLVEPLHQIFFAADAFILAEVEAGGCFGLSLETLDVLILGGIEVQVAVFVVDRLDLGIFTCDLDHDLGSSRQDISESGLFRARPSALIQQPVDRKYRFAQSASERGADGLQLLHAKLAECLDALFEVAECLARLLDLTDQELEALLFQRLRPFRGRELEI